MTEKKIHFITGLKSDFGGKPFRFVHYMAIRSAITLNPEFQIFVYYKYMPSGPYWDIIRRHVTEVVVEPPTHIFGNEITHFAHQADILRLEILLREGGVYLDTDTICCRPFDPLLGDRVVMGIEGFAFGFDAWNAGDRLGLCNAVILAPAGAEFLVKWLASYTDFDKDNWNQHSVFRPAELARAHPHLINVEPPERFFWPVWDEAGIRSLFVETHEFPESVSIHLWESISWPHLEHLDYDSVMRNDTSYNLIARRFLDADEAELQIIVDRTRDESSFRDTIDASRAQFEAIYDRGIWGQGSGVGSSPEVSKPYVDFLLSFIKLNSVGSIVDFGCGDWQFSRFIDWGNIEYHGFDIVRSVIRDNVEKFGRPGVSFTEFHDFGQIPSVDLIVAKEMMQHVPNQTVLDYIGALRQKCRFLVLTNDETPVERLNKDIAPGGWRSLRLDQQPFCLDGSYIFSYLSPSEGLVKSTFLIRGEMP